MNWNLNCCKILAVLIAFCATLSCAKHPPYQVSLYINIHPKGLPVLLCNGIIVQSRLILTTASCVHYQFSSSSPVDLIPPAMMSVTSGSSTPFSDDLTVRVSDIIVRQNFNYTTGENDLALLRLSNKLPLNTRNDMSWITLDDVENYSGPCLANFYIRNPLNEASNHIQSEELPILDSEACMTGTNDYNKRKDDICSLYHIPTDFNCEEFDTAQRYNDDRGTGLVCNNMLVGILSTILPWQKNNESIQKPIRVFYTSISPHLSWIYNEITLEEVKMLQQGEYISSSAYAGENNELTESGSQLTGETNESTESGLQYNNENNKLTEPGSTLAYSNFTSSTDPSVHPNAAADVIGNCKFLLLIMQTYFILARLN